ncbi:MAG: toprim domain-containing protein [Prevotellaceae bacterium]|nr:toprim domain-containing protein [Candidatus Minthosoma equi]
MNKNIKTTNIKLTEKKQYNCPYRFPAEFLIKNCINQSDAQPLINYLTENRKLNIDLLQKYRVTIPYGSFADPSSTSDSKAGYSQQRCISFNYFDRGGYINYKYRTIDKRFSLLFKGELIPYNIDSLIGKPVCYITEGEFDALTLIQCGYLETISVPNGAQKNLSWLDRFVETHFEDKKRIVLALDSDEKGIMLRNELIRRLDSERCQLVKWKADCKDANEVLMRYGEDAVRECIKAACDIPLIGIQTANDVRDELQQLFEHGMQRGASVHMGEFDNLMTFETGRYMVVSGRPGDGKSEFIDELCLRLCLYHDWKIAYFSPENVPITYHLRKLCEKLTRYPFQESKRMTTQLFNACVHWLSENVCHILPGYGEDGIVYGISESQKFGISETLNFNTSENQKFRSSDIHPTNDSNTLDNILEIAHLAVARRGVRILVIDPLNRIEQDMQDGKSELQWYSHVNNTLSRFARRHKCLVILVAHPRKVNRANLDGKKRRVEMNDINGSADFGNKADYCLIVDRDDDLQVVTIFVDKVKFKHLGTRGKCYLHYDKISGRYVPCTLREINLVSSQLSKPCTTIVQNNSGTKFEKTIDWTNFQTTWINEEGMRIL